MPNNSRVCSILIIDNDVNYAKKVAFELEQIRPDLLLNHTLEIEISNTAYFIGKCLDKLSNENPPWDIILSDVYMPMPSSPLDKNTPQEVAHQRILNYKEKQWKFWAYDYTWNSHMDGLPDYGGLYVAQKLKVLRETSQNIRNLKVVLISDKLFDFGARDRIYEFLKTEKSWFNYYDKTNWEENTEDWPSHLNEPSVFRWAVIHAINERGSEFWGDFLLNRKDSIPIVSKALKAIAIRCKTLGKDRNVNRILITGERGTGKSMIANMLHEMRMKTTGKNGQLVTVECTSISDELFEGGLFGHIKGAFTGADIEKTGFVETAKNGTLFFDEIGDLSPANQGKVLRLLQENQFVKVGGNENFKMEASLVVFATNRDLEQLVEEGLFRADLYDRMNPPPIEIPSLRDRNDEIITLAEHFIESSDKNLKLSEEAKMFLKSQAWEGNVRQLKSTIAKAATFCTTIELNVTDLQKFIPVNLFKNKNNIPMSSLYNSENQHKFTPENILNGKIKWASIKRKPYPERAAVMVIVKSRWDGSQNQLADLLGVKANSLEQFFSTLRRKINKLELNLEDLKTHINSEFYPLLDEFFMPNPSNSNR